MSVARYVSEKVPLVYKVCPTKGLSDTAAIVTCQESGGRGRIMYRMCCQGLVQDSETKRLVLSQGVHPGRLVVNKPDIPVPMHRGCAVTRGSPEACCSAHADLGKSAHTGDTDCRSSIIPDSCSHAIERIAPTCQSRTSLFLQSYQEIPHITGMSVFSCSCHSPRRLACACRACAAAEALRSYDGPTAFAIPGNHDWIDGLETFQRFIQHKGWLGGWLLPQVCAIPYIDLCMLLADRSFAG